MLDLFSSTDHEVSILHVIHWECERIFPTLQSFFVRKGLHRMIICSIVRPKTGWIKIKRWKTQSKRNKTDERFSRLKWVATFYASVTFI